MNDKGEICIGMAGAGRATELHMDALCGYVGLPFCLKHIIARRKEQVEVVKAKYGFQKASLDFEDLLKDDEIDVIDICTPPYIHEEMIIRGLRAGKHVICEKPLSGYFGREGDPEPVGIGVSKSRMYEGLLESMDMLEKEIRKSDRKFMYAENFVYAPAIRKAAEIIRMKGSRILYAKGEESLKGSSSPVAGEWCRTGGGTFIRTGIHPLSAILRLKQVEAEAHGKEIKVVSVLADMAQITPGLTEYEHRHIAARPKDVEDSSTVILTFSDKTKATILATDTLLGGSKNYVELYCNDAVVDCKITMSDLMQTYFLDEEGLTDVYLSEMLPSKTGWNRTFLSDEIIRGYVDEMKDFMEAIYFDREPEAGFQLAKDVIQLVYAAYKSSELGRVVEL